MIQKAKGTLDILPEQAGTWQYIENTIRNLCSIYGFSETRVPTFESTELFSRGVGDTTDIVQKEMYTFTDRESRSFTLRPEGTAGIMRSVIENSLYSETLPLKLYYIMNCFRYEQPQAGRSREFWQFGIEHMGSVSAVTDSEVISLADRLFTILGVGDDIGLNINSIGCPVCRPEYNKKLKEYLTEKYDDLCDTCKIRFEKNPMRTLDCKSKICKSIVAEAPKSKDHLCPDCEDHFKSLQNYLGSAGIKYEINPLIVRGFDYYTKTVFEFVSNSIGAQGTVCGGGRYDGLCEMIGGPKLPGIGFGLGLTRLIACIEAKKAYVPEKRTPKVYIAALPSADDSIQRESFRIVTELRQEGVYAVTDNMNRSFKSQMKYADKINAKYTCILGESELSSGNVQIKNMKTSEQFPLPIDSLITFLTEN